MIETILNKTMRPGLPATVTVLAALLTAGPAAATIRPLQTSGESGLEKTSEPTSRPLTVRDVVDYRSLPIGTSIHVSPDGRRVAFTVEGPQRTFGGRTLDVLPQHGDVRTRIHVVDLATGSVAKLGGDASSWAPAWSPDGQALAFFSTRDGAPRLWLWSAAESRVRRISGKVAWTAFMRKSARWTPDGRSLLVKLLPRGRTIEEAARRAEPAPPSAPDDGEAGTTARVFTSDPATPGSEFPEWLPWQYGGDLARISVSTGEVERLTRNRLPTWWDVSADGSMVAFMDLRATESVPARFALSVVSTEGGEVRDLADGIAQTWGEAVSWSPSGSHIAYVGGGRDGGVFVMDASSGETLTQVVPRSGWGAPAPPVWTRDGRALLFTDGDVWRAPVDGGKPARAAVLPNREVLGVLTPLGRSAVAGSDERWVVRLRDPKTGNTGFGRVDARSGELVAEALESAGDGSAGRVDLTADGRTVVTRFPGPTLPPDLWLLDEELRRERRVSRLNPAFDSVRLATSRLVRWTTADGRSLEGTLLLPPGRAEGERVPVVVQVYGGRSGASALHGFHRYRQLLATNGFGVFVPDVPLEVGTPMAGHTAAVDPGIDRLVELGIADPDGIGAYGHSYGGYGTLALLAESDRFDAGVASASHGNMAGAFAYLAEDGSAQTRWAESGQGRMGTTPWGDPETYVHNSPLFFLDRVEAPLLMLHGADDRNTPAYLAAEIFTGLRHLGRTVAFVSYAGEGHDWRAWSFPNKLDYWRRLLDWFDEHLR